MFNNDRVKKYQKKDIQGKHLGVIGNAVTWGGDSCYLRPYIVATCLK